MKESGHRFIGPSGHLVIWRLSGFVIVPWGDLVMARETRKSKLEDATREPEAEFRFSNFEFRSSTARWPDDSMAQLCSELVEGIEEFQAGETCEVPIAGGEGRPVLDG